MNLKPDSHLSSHYNVKKYTIYPQNVERWVVVGKNREYFINENSCTCQNFLVKHRQLKNSDCKHLKELKEAKTNNHYDSFSISINEYRKLRKYLFRLKK